MKTTQLELAILEEIQQLHSEIIRSARTTLDKAIRIGELLTKQKASLKHGQWLPWVKENLPFTEDTAQNYLRVYRRRTEIPKDSVFGLTDAYRLLAAPTETEEEQEMSVEPESDSGGLNGFGVPEPVDLKNGKSDFNFRTETVQPVNSSRPLDLPKLEECPTCHRSFDPLNWDPRQSGFSCPYCWKDSTEKKPARTSESPLNTKLVHVSHNSGENEWYTPSQYIDAAIAVMGAIDLDPASCEVANKTVRAKQFFSIKEDGLLRKWKGRIWLNPPYGQPLITQFTEKAATEFESGRIDQACILINNATETAWFQQIAKHAAAICFLTGRIRFLDKTGTPALTPLQGQAVLYLGKRVSAFTKQFKSLGIVLLGQ